MIRRLILLIFIYFITITGNMANEDDFPQSDSPSDYFSSACNEECDDDCDDLLGRYKNASTGCDICGRCIKEGKVQGDILLNNETYDNFREKYKGSDCDDKSQRGAINGDRWKWPKQNGVVVVPYKFHATVYSNKQQKIRDVFNLYQSRTCIRFIRRTNQRNYLNITGVGGCSSYVGRVGNGPQTLNLGRGCENRKGTIIHELMHALGFWHEQARGDRDSYITINYHNIKSGAERNFDKQKSWNGYNTNYDVNSVMHYGGYFFSRNGDPTIIDRKTRKPIVANRNDFSPNDIIEINRHYDCQGYQGVSSSGNQQPVRPAVITTTTRAPSSSGSCRDKNNNCNYWKRKDYCIRNHVNFMRKTCPQSCGFCQSATTTSPRITTTTKSIVNGGTSSCKDLKPATCPQLAKDKYCQHSNPAYRDYMKRTCPLSCNFCSNIIRPVIPSNCRDNNKNCNYWASNQYCSNAKFRSFMRSSCQRSCGYCLDGQVITPSPTSPRTTPKVSGNDQCGIPSGDLARSTVHRIVGGRSAYYGSVPWIVSLRQSNDHDFCGATLIGSRFVVTAAHCFYQNDKFNPDVSRIFGYVGKHYRRGSQRDAYQQRISFSRLIPHPNYNHFTSENDIAILVVRRPVPFGSHVKAVCLPRENERLYPGTEATISGWGETKRGTPDVLQTVEVNVISNSECNAWLRRYNDRGKDEVTQNMFCAGFKRGGKDACQGDSGGPLTVRQGSRHILAGIISWGYGCAERLRPGVYTKVSEKVRWIKQVMRQY